jgi:putative flippase GtrA
VARPLSRTPGALRLTFQMSARPLLRRWLAFNAVGGLGVLLQLTLLALMVHLAGLHYLLATIVAVEATILHNFVWHDRWTWGDRRSTSRTEALARLARFNMLNGAVSLAGNVVAMAVLAGSAGIEPVVANMIAIALCSIANFAASETMVFKSAGVASVVVVLSLPATAWAGPGKETVHEWKAYASKVDGRFAAASADGTFFTLDGPAKNPGWRETVKGGVAMTEIETPGISGGKIHHWVGAVFVPGARLEDVVSRLRGNAGKEADFYDDVLASRLVSADGDRAVIYMKLRRESVITVTYNTEHDVEYRRLGRSRAASRSVATRIAELAGAGTQREREKAADEDHGFLWRLNAYWRYEQIDGGVLIECESVSLSRGIPTLLRPFVTGTVNRIARESLEKTLKSVRAFLTGASRNRAVESTRSSESSSAIELVSSTSHETTRAFSAGRS